MTTKASAVTSLSSFNASAVTGAVSDTQVWTNVSFSGDNVDGYKGDKWWPVEDQNYRFFASNLSLTYSSSGATVAATNATDVVCAYSASPTYKTRNTLSFEHIFARLGEVTVTAATGYTISNVSITVVPKTGGTYNLKTGAGQTDGTGWSSVSEAGSPSTIASATGANANDIYLVPGTYTLTASWRAVRGDYTEDIEGMQCDVSLTAGKINNITTTLSGNAQEVVFSVSIAAWTNQNVVAEFPTLGPANGHDYVDLGLRVGGNKILFATMNIGASSPEEYGDYFAWGETSKRYTSISGSSVVGGSFEFSNCPYHTGNDPYEDWSKYIPTDRADFWGGEGSPDNKLTLDASDDVASALWGGGWRMPNSEEICMLINGNGTSIDRDEADNVTYSWTDDYNSTGVAGMIVTGKGSFSSASLFLPAAGNCSNTNVNDNGSGRYWSRTATTGLPYNACILYFEYRGGLARSVGANSRRDGCSVRPVLVLPE